MDVTTATFERDVIEKSREHPVVVDFWAAWCGPCRALAPAIESEVAKRSEQILLAKVDVDAETTIADPLRHPEHPDGGRLRERRARHRIRRRPARAGDQQILERALIRNHAAPVEAA